MGKIFFESQSWAGFDCAYASWHNAFWKWVDQETPADVVAKVKAIHQWDSSMLPATAEGPPEWRIEVTCQQYFVRRLIFLLVMHGPEAQDPDMINRFAKDIHVASKIGDRTYVEALAKQKQRKPTQDTGDRRLKHQLMLCWIPGCLWAFTTDGIAQFLNTRYPRSRNALYDNKTISDARRGWKLFRSPKPLWWGIAGEPPRLIRL